MALISLVSADSNPYRYFPNAHQEAPPAAQARIKTPAASPTLPKGVPNASASDASAPEAGVAAFAPDAIAPEADATAPGVEPSPAARSGLPSTALRPEYEALGRIGHAVEYGLLGFLLARALALTLLPAGRARIGLVLGFGFGLALAFGFADELHQSGVAGRTYQTVDLMLDGLGAAAGALIYARQRAYIFVKPGKTLKG